LIIPSQQYNTRWGPVQPHGWGAHWPEGRHARALSPPPPRAPLAAATHTPKHTPLHTKPAQLEQELARLQLRVERCTADGNCFFRALCRQLDGDEGGHAALRGRVVDFVLEHADDFAPFVEDDEALV
jgi:OTU domain-containing protein 3